MSTGFFKRNEKVMMTILLALIAPTFAATGLVTWYSNNSTTNASYEINGQTITSQDFFEKRMELSETLWLQNVRRFGPYAARTDRFRQATVDDVLKQFVLEHEITRVGIEPSDASKDAGVKAAALDICTWYRVMEQSGWIGTYQERFPDFSSGRAIARLDLDTYSAALTDDRFGISMSKKDFEETVIRSLRVQTLIESVVDAAVVTEKEVFEEYSTNYEKRVLELIQISSENYLEQASEQTTPEDVEAIYNANPERFVLANRLAVEVARVDRTGLRNSMTYEPTPEEIEAKYEADKSTVYRIRRPNNYVPPEGATPEDDIRPLINVFDNVVNSLVNDQMMVLEAETLNNALESLTAMKDAGETVPMEQAFAEGADYVEVRQIDSFVQRDVNLLDVDVKNPAAYATFFMQERREPGSVKPGDLYQSIVTNGRGNFIIRVVEMLPERTMTYDEAIEPALKAAQEAQAKKIVEEYASSWVTRIQSGEEGATFDALSEDGNFTIHEMDPVSRTQSFNLKIDNRIIPARAAVIEAAFEIEVVGGLAGPVTNEADQSEYVVRLKEIAAPDMDLYKSLKLSTENRLRSDKQRALLDAFQVRLMENANIRVYQGEGDAVSRDQLIENAETDPEGEQG
ncbi:MAG: SurA N-terminal domain-containing protein [Planctomycetota bacterium]|nr:SurA N-terminal domain-containing protein [Planctomycetota bacterium]